MFFSRQLFQSQPTIRSALETVKKLNAKPYGFEPYNWQTSVWDFFVKDDTSLKKAYLLWARRHGKDVLSFSILINRALLKKGTYWYVFPQYSQAEKSIVEGFFATGKSYMDLIPPNFAKLNRGKLRFEFKNGSVIRLIGSENLSMLRGASVRGIVLSEYAQMSERIHEVIDLIYMRSKGWLLMNTTPFGHNHAEKMWNYIEKESKSNPQKFFASKITNSISQIFSLEEIESLKKQGWTEELVAQELECEFNSPLQGSFYGHIFKKQYEQEHLGSFPYMADSPVDTYWDLGIDNHTCIWFVQKRNKSYFFVNFLDLNDTSLVEIVAKIKMLNYNYGTHYLPHDAAKREMSSLEQLKTLSQNAGLNRVEVLKRPPLVLPYIYKAISLFSICYFDSIKCEKGIYYLKNYHRKFDKIMNRWTDDAHHDYSDGADAFRLFVQNYRQDDDIFEKARPVRISR